MNRLLLVLAALGVVPLGACMSAWVGLGVLRGLPTVEIVSVAVALTALPVAGTWALSGQRPWGLVLGAWAWPVMLLLAIPGYFPGELSDALSTGLSVFASPVGRDAARIAAARGAQLADAAPNVTGNARAAEAKQAVAECPPAFTLGDDQVALPYEGQGHSMIIPVQFGDVELPMLFDTGASFTTLNQRALASLGIRVPPHAPVVTLHTANGDRSAQLVVVPQVWVGGLGVEGVTVAVCEECADERVSGLLGLNVSGQFLVTIDTAGQQVLFQPRAGDPDRVIDVQPWLDSSATVTLFADGRGEAEATATNNGTRTVKRAAVGIRCGAEHLAVELGTIAPGETASDRVRLPRDASCQSYRVTLDHARW